MTIEFKCPHCHKPLEASDEIAGKKGKCPSCGQTVTIPPKAEEPAKKS